jgi:hypothetical protein
VQGRAVLTAFADTPGKGRTDCPPALPGAGPQNAARKKPGGNRRAMKQELKTAIVDLQRTFNKSGLACLWVAFGVGGTFIATMDSDAKTERYELPSDAFDLDDTDGRGPD